MKGINLLPGRKAGNERQSIGCAVAGKIPEIPSSRDPAMSQNRLFNPGENDT